jgi:hypothetical protein
MSEIPKPKYLKKQKAIEETKSAIYPKRIRILRENLLVKLGVFVEMPRRE